MRVGRIEFKGYKRLADTATNIDGDLTAFVGFNEAGKTSLLHALAWFSRGDALETTSLNRSRPPIGGEAVVRVYFELSEDERTSVAKIPAESHPTSLVVERDSDGNSTYRFFPDPRRPLAPFKTARERLFEAQSALSPHFARATSEDEPDPNDWTESVLERLQTPDLMWSEDAIDELTQLRDWAGDIPDGKSRARDSVLARRLSEVLTIVGRPLPSTEMYSVLGGRRPEFVLFRDEHRTLETS